MHNGFSPSHVYIIIYKSGACCTIWKGRRQVRRDGSGRFCTGIMCVCECVLLCKLVYIVNHVCTYTHAYICCRHSACMVPSCTFMHNCMNSSHTFYVHTHKQRRSERQRERERDREMAAHLAFLPSCAHILTRAHTHAHCAHTHRWRFSSHFSKLQAVVARLTRRARREVSCTVAQKLYVPAVWRARSSRKRWLTLR